MARIVSIKRKNSDGDESRQQFLVYLSKKLLDDAKLRPGDELEFESKERGILVARKVN